MQPFEEGSVGASEAPIGHLGAFQKEVPSALHVLSFLGPHGAGPK